MDSKETKRRNPKMKSQRLN